MPKLGVNIDHVATLREARGESYPDPVAAALICEAAGADSIVAHLREDRRHIQDRDVVDLRRRLSGRFNLEMGLAREIVSIACDLMPDQVTLVPERRQEVTTEGGLDVMGLGPRGLGQIRRLQKTGIEISVFVDPVKRQIRHVHELGIPVIELHTGAYANARGAARQARELAKLREASRYARDLGLVVNAGHGLTYENTAAVAKIPGLHELNIGHSIISHAVIVGLRQAVVEMRRLAKGGGR